MIVPILALGMTMLTAVGVLFKTVVELKRDREQEQKYEGLVKNLIINRRPLNDILKPDIVDVNEIGIGCAMPYIDPFNKEIMAFNKTPEKFTCGGADWVKCRWSICRVVPQALKQLTNVKCGYRYIIYENDKHYYVSNYTHKRYGSEEFILVHSDHVSVFCEAVTSRKKSSWKGLVSGFRTANITRSAPHPDDTVNVLIIAFDSTSRNRFIREMPHSYKFLKNELGAVFYNKYNVVGDGTSAAMYAMLIGASEQEGPDTRKWMGDLKVDHTRLLFHKFKSNGYRTAYFEDMPDVGTFQFRHNGFSSRPADHTLMDLLLEVDLNRGRTAETGYYCLGAKPQYKFMMDKTEDFFKLEGKKFCFTFIADVSHDGFNGMGIADDDLVRLLKNMKLNGQLNNTLTFVMGDHGYRNSWRVNEKYHGKLEVRLPFMAIILPEKLTEQRPEIESPVKANADVLTTPYDIHTTILDAANMKRYSNRYKADGSSLRRGLSLFEPIPPTRSCGDAGMRPQWCACHRWVSMNPQDTLSQRAGQAVVDRINELTSPYRFKCKKFELKLVLAVERLQAGHRMLTYSRPDDGDGYKGHYVDYEPWYNFEYKIQIMVIPSEMFSAHFTYLSSDDRFNVTLDGIKRRSNFNCDISFYIAELCYCRDTIAPLLNYMLDGQQYVDQT